MGVERLVTLYLKAKEHVSHAGYDTEIRWQASLEFGESRRVPFCKRRRGSCSPQASANLLFGGVFDRCLKPSSIGAAQRR